MRRSLLDDVVVGPGHDGEFPTKNLEIRKTATVRDETQSMAIATARSRPISEAKQGWARASSAKTRGFHTQLDEGPETP